MSTASLQVAVIGAGNMGMGMVQRLRACGAAVHVRDPDLARQRQATQLGATVHSTAADVVASATVILVAVVDAAQMRSALSDEEHAAMECLGSSHTVLLMSTIAPEEMQAIAQQLQARGARVVDAPMSGGPQRAIDGQLSVMLAGARQDIAAAQSVLDLIANKQFYVGDQIGQGATMKLINNLLAGINLVAGAQVLAAGERAGLPLQTMLDVFAASSAHTWIVNERMQRYASGDQAVNSHMSILTKDLTLAMQLVNTLPAHVPLGEHALQHYQRSVAAGLALHDDNQVLTLARQLNQ